MGLISYVFYDFILFLHENLLLQLSDVLFRSVFDESMTLADAVKTIEDSVAESSSSILVNMLISLIDKKVVRLIFFSLGCELERSFDLSSPCIHSSNRLFLSVGIRVKNTW